MCLSLTGSTGNAFLSVIGPGAELLKIAPYYASLHVILHAFGMERDLMCLARTPEMGVGGGPSRNLVAHHTSPLRFTSTRQPDKQQGGGGGRNLMLW